MSKKKRDMSEYLGKHLTNLENLPINKDTLYIADSITSIDKHTYRKDWLKVYRKCKKLVEYLEEKTEINNEETHYFLYLAPLLKNLYFNAYSSLVKVYTEAPKLNDEDWDSMDEFVATVRSKYGEMLEEMIPPTPRKSAYNRLMTMTREIDNSDVTKKYKEVMEKLEDIRLKLDNALLVIHVEDNHHNPAYADLETILLDAETSILEVKMML